MMDRRRFATDFRELRVYQDAYQATMEIFEITKFWPPEERYELSDQVRRSSRSTCRCIAEAWFKRRYPRHFSSKLTDASSEAAETIVSMDFAAACGYIEEAQRSDFDQKYYQIIGGLVKMMSEPERWCGLQNSVRETDESYGIDQESMEPSIRLWEGQDDGPAEDRSETQG